MHRLLPRRPFLKTAPTGAAFALSGRPGSRAETPLTPQDKIHSRIGCFISKHESALVSCRMQAVIATTPVARVARCVFIVSPSA